jgi:colanic acid/amylovoran biosynthesis protein
MKQDNNTHNNATHPLFILAGNGSNFNRGCEAILRGTVHILAAHFPDPQLIAVTSYKREEQFEYQRTHETDRRIVHKKMHKSYRTGDPLFFLINGLRIVCPRVLRHIIYQEAKPYLPEAQAVLALGGDNYSLDYTKGPLWLTKGPVAYVELDNLALSHRKPMILWGASVGPFSRSPRYERYMIDHLRRVHIFAREPATVDYLASQGLRDNVHRVADPAFVMPPEAPPGGYPVAEGAIGLNLSPLLARFATQGNLEQWKEIAAQIVNALSQRTKRPIYLIPHVVGGLSISDDTFLQDVLRRETLTARDVTLVSSDYSAPQVKWIISQMAAFAGARMHSTIAAPSSAVPTLSFSYSIKSKGVNTDIFGHTDYCLAPKEVTPETVAERMEALLQERTAVREHLIERLDHVKTMAMKSGDLLKAILASPQS